MKHIGTRQMTYQAALQKIEQAKAEQWEELDLAGMRLTEVKPELCKLTNLNFSDNRLATGWRR